jgi:hypothetical protein
MLTGSSRSNRARRSGAEPLCAAADGPVAFKKATCRIRWSVAVVASTVAIASSFANDALAQPKQKVVRAVPEHRSVEHHAKQDTENPSPSPVVRKFHDWIVESGNNNGLPFAIIDKVGARLYVYRPDGQLRGAAPVLLGVAKGDDSVPGIGERELSDMPPEVRTTPAGRFVSALGRNLSGKDVVWVDYESAISMHRVINTNPKERRPHRLATPTPADNRISYGCINVPIKFFDDVVLPSFDGTNGIVYVLPEVHPLRKVFAGYREPGRSAVAGASAQSAGSD